MLRVRPPQRTSAAPPHPSVGRVPFSGRSSRRLTPPDHSLSRSFARPAHGARASHIHTAFTGTAWLLLVCRFPVRKQQRSAPRGRAVFISIASHERRARPAAGNVG